MHRMALVMAGVFAAAALASAQAAGPYKVVRTEKVGGASSDSSEALDEDDAARGAYNEWLARLDKQR